MIMCHNVFNVWPKTTLLLPVWPRDAKRSDTPVRTLKGRTTTSECVHGLSLFLHKNNGEPSKATVMVFGVLNQEHTKLIMGTGCVS